MSGKKRLFRGESYTGNPKSVLCLAGHLKSGMSYKAVYKLGSWILAKPHFPRIQGPSGSDSWRQDLAAGSRIWQLADLSGSWLTCLADLSG